MQGSEHHTIAVDRGHDATAGAQSCVTANADLRPKVQGLLDELSKLRGVPLWVTQTYCQRGRYLPPHHGARSEAVRAQLARRELPA